jgi:peptide subunit release factor 1 (eRF1)
MCPWTSLLDAFGPERRGGAGLCFEVVEKGVAMQVELPGTPHEESRFETIVHDLAAFRTEEGVLSVYLDIDPATAQREGYEAALMDLWKPLFARPLDEWTRGRLEYEVAAATEVVRAWAEPPGRSAAMFFSGPGGLCTVLPLQFPIRPTARFEPRPVLSPLISVFDDHRRYCAVVFDKEQARIITVFLGGVEEEVVLHGEVLGRTAAGGWGQANYARHREYHLHEHARRTVEQLWAMDRARPIHSLILGGPDEAVEVLRRVMPAALARLVVARVHIEMFASTSDVVTLVSTIDAAAREREDAALVAKLTTEAEKGGRASIGWHDTLQAVGEARVHELVLPEGVTRPGVQCPEGHFLATCSLKFCPLCDEPLWETDDIVENAVRVALHTDARIHFLAPEAGKALAEVGPAAVLRY